MLHQKVLEEPTGKEHAHRNTNYRTALQALREAEAGPIATAAGSASLLSAQSFRYCESQRQRFGISQQAVENGHRGISKLMNEAAGDQIVVERGITPMTSAENVRGWRPTTERSKTGRTARAPAKHR